MRECRHSSYLRANRVFLTSVGRHLPLELLLGLPHGPPLRRHRLLLAPGGVVRYGLKRKVISSLKRFGTSKIASLNYIFWHFHKIIPLWRTKKISLFQVTCLNLEQKLASDLKHSSILKAAGSSQKNSASSASSLPRDTTSSFKCSSRPEAYCKEMLSL